MTIAIALESIGIVTGVIAGIAGLVLSILSFRRQAKSESRTDERLARAEAREQEAHLDLELRPEGGGSVMLVIHNHGPSAAWDVTIDGALDRGGYQQMRHFPRLVEHSEQALVVPQPGYYIIAGNSHFDVQVTWTDGLGTHGPVQLVATRRIPYSD